jgi:hypothetical protein
VRAKTRHRRVRSVSGVRRTADTSESHWREEVTALNLRPENFLTLAVVACEFMDRLKTGPLLTKEASVMPNVEWERAYVTPPQSMATLLNCLDPTIQLPLSDEDMKQSSQGKENFSKSATTISQVLSLVNPATGMIDDATVSEHPGLKQMCGAAMASVPQLRLEIRSAADNIKALMVYRTTMYELLAAGKAGADKALFRAITINSDLVDVKWIADRIHRAIRDRDRTFLRKLGRAVEGKPLFHRLAQIGVILSMGWDAGLKKVSSRQLVGFLKEAGLQSIPKPTALERYAQRLGLRKYYLEPDRGR